MKRTLLTLALVAAAGTAGAQTVRPRRPPAPPSAATMTPVTAPPITAPAVNTGDAGALRWAPARSRTTPDEQQRRRCRRPTRPDDHGQMNSNMSASGVGRRVGQAPSMANAPRSA